MSLINYSLREVSCKIVYYGPGLGGKTTNIQYVYNRLRPESKGRLISLATEMDRTLFFDFLPLDLGSIKGFRTRFHLYTVPGQVYYDASRKLILRELELLRPEEDTALGPPRAGVGGDLRPAPGTRLAQRGVRLLDARKRTAELKVAFEGSDDQGIQIGVAEVLPPALGHRPLGGTRAKRLRHFDRRWRIALDLVHRARNRHRGRRRD